MELRDYSSSSNFVKLPISSLGRLERGASVLKEKILLIVLSTILLLVSSLSASFFIVDTIITSPPFNSVKSVYNSYILEIQFQRDSYQSCIQKSIDRCNTTLSTQYEAEVNRSLATEMENRIFINEMEYLTTQMKEIISNISIILNENWILQRGVDVYSDSCSSTDKDSLVSVYQGNRDEESLLTTLEQHQNATVSAMAQVLSQFNERMEYDQQYLQRMFTSLVDMRMPFVSNLTLFLGNITFPLEVLNTSQLARCITMDSSCQLINSMYNQYIKILNDYENQKQVIQRQILTTKSRVSGFVNSVDGVIAEVQELYIRISEVRDLLDFYGINLGILPELYIPPLILPDIEWNWDLPTAEEIYLKLESHRATMQLEFIQTVNETKNAVDHAVRIVTEYTDRLPTIFADYDPPFVNTSLIMEEFSRNIDTFIDTTWTTIVNSSTTVTRFLNETKYEVTTFLPIIRDSIYSFFSTWSPRAFVGLDMDISSILSRFEIILRLAVWCDMILRICSLVRTIMRVLMRGKLSTLSIHVGGNEAKTQYCQTLIYLVGIILPYLIPILIAVVVIVIGVITVILVYVPLLQGYITGCVETSSGTFLTQNLYSLAYNYVTMQGDSAATIVLLRE
ncbi:hypothetical protein WA171_002505 [Blastocystis sp. BT1]